MEPFLRVCDISYAYHSPLGATPALSGISFTVNKANFLPLSARPAAASQPCFPFSPAF